MTTVIDLRDEPMRIAQLLANFGKSLDEIAGGPQKREMAKAIFENPVLGQGIAEAYQLQVAQQPSIRGSDTGGAGELGQTPVLSSAQEMAKRVAMQRAGLTPEMVTTANTLYGQSPEVQTRLAQIRSGLPQKKVAADVAQAEAAVSIAQAQGTKAGFDISFYSKLDPDVAAAVQNSSAGLTLDQHKTQAKALEAFNAQFESMSPADKQLWATATSQPQFLDALMKRYQLGQTDRSLSQKDRELDIREGEAFLEAQWKQFQASNTANERAESMARFRISLNEELRKLIAEGEKGGSEEYLRTVQGRISDLMRTQSSFFPNDYITNAEVLNGWTSSPKMQVGGFRPNSQEDPRIASVAGAIMRGETTMAQLIAREHDKDLKRRISPEARQAVIEFIQNAVAEQNTGYKAWANKLWYTWVTGTKPEWYDQFGGGPPSRGSMPAPPVPNIPRGLPQNNRELGGR